MLSNVWAAGAPALHGMEEEQGRITSGVVGVISVLGAFPSCCLPAVMLQPFGGGVCVCSAPPLQLPNKGCQIRQGRSDLTPAWLLELHTCQGPQSSSEQAQWCWASFTNSSREDLQNNWKGKANTLHSCSWVLDNKAAAELL